MTRFYDVEVEADRYEDQLELSREFHEEMWFLIEGSNAGTVVLSHEQERECWAYLTSLFAA